MRHLTTLLLCLLPALALGQSAVTVRGPAGAPGSDGASGSNAAAPLSLPGTPVLQADGSTLISAEDGEIASVSGSPRLLPWQGRTIIQPNGGYYYWSDLAKPSAWTVAAVFRQDSLAAEPRVMGGITSASATAWGYLLVRSDGRLEYQFGDGTNFSQGRSPASSIAAGQWHTVVVTYAGGGATEAVVYIDGVSVAVTTISTAASSTAGAAPIFSCGNGGNISSNKPTLVAACIAWDVALDAGQVATATATLQSAFGLE